VGSKRVITMRRMWLSLPLSVAWTVHTFAGGDPPKFGTEARVVAIDVVARGPDDRPLEDLRPKEVQVFENGRRCEVRSFRLVRESGSFAAEGWPVPNSSSTRSDTGPLAPGTSHIVLFFDRLSIASGPLARRAALDFLNHDFPASTWFAVVSGVDRRFAVPFTNDLAAVREWILAATFGDTQNAPAAAEPESSADGERHRADAQGTFSASDLDTIFGIEGVAHALGSFRGRKTILYFAEGWQMAAGVRPQYEEAVSAATLANVTVHTFDARGLEARKLVQGGPLDGFVGSASAERRGGPFGGRMTPATDGVGTPATELAGPNLEELAEDTGGRAVANTNDLRAALATLRQELGLYYEIVYTPADQATDGRFRRISIKVTRPGVRTRTRKGYFASAGDVHVGGGEGATSGLPAAAGATPALNQRGDAVAQSQPLVVAGGPAVDASLVPVLDEAARYVAEEAYSQSVFVGMRDTPGPWTAEGAPPTQRLDATNPATLLKQSYRTRKTRADLVFVRLPGDVPWSLFRDVFEVDGRKVRDRDERLQRLFQNPSPSALVQAQRIVEEGARYNIGGAARTVNVPTMPLMFLLARNQPRCSFRSGPRRWISGVAAFEVEFDEVARPTVVTTSSGESLPAHGRFWIDASRGAVIRTEVVFRFDPSLAEASFETDYEPRPRLGLWVPVLMRERYRNLPSAPRVVFAAPTDATATYSNYRQFTVTSEEGNATVVSP